MRKIFIYYSLTGNGDFVASKMLENGYEVRKVIEKKKMPKSFFGEYLSEVLERELIRKQSLSIMIMIFLTMMKSLSAHLFGMVVSHLRLIRCF